VERRDSVRATFGGRRSTDVRATFGGRRSIDVRATFNKRCSIERRLIYRRLSLQYDQPPPCHQANPRVITRAPRGARPRYPGGEV